MSIKQEEGVMEDKNAKILWSNAKNSLNAKIYIIYNQLLLDGLMFLFSSLYTMIYHAQWGVGGIKI